jgi:chaperonin cofactor prefoldin
MAQVEVLAVDQEKINKFGNLNTQCVALKMELADLEKKKTSFEGAGDELELAEAEGTVESTPYQIGTS